MGGYVRIELPDRAGSGVSRVCEQLLAILRLALVEGLEVGRAHVDFPADFQARWRRRTIRTKRNPHRHRRHSPRVGGDFLSDHTISARGCAYQPTLFIRKSDRQPVNLRLDDELPSGVCRHQSLDTFEPRPQLVLTERISKTHHRHGVLHADESFPRLCTNPLSRRVRRNPIWMARLNVLQLPHEEIVVVVTDLWFVQHVVTMVVVPDELLQFVEPCHLIYLVHSASSFRPGPAVNRTHQRVASKCRRPTQSYRPGFAAATTGIRLLAAVLRVL